VGTGAVGVAVGIAFAVVRGSKLSESDGLCREAQNGCKDGAEEARYHSLIGDAKSAATVGAVGLVAGGLLTAGGLVLVFTAPHEGKSVTAMPVFTPGFVGAQLTAHGF
jgi:hypothetical protein